MISISEGNNKINIEEPFKGLFTQNGMSQAETKTMIVSPDEIETVNGHTFEKK